MRPAPRMKETAVAAAATRWMRTRSPMREARADAAAPTSCPRRGPGPDAKGACDHPDARGLVGWSGPLSRRFLVQGILPLLLPGRPGTGAAAGPPLLRSGRAGFMGRGCRYRNAHTKRIPSVRSGATVCAAFAPSRCGSREFVAGPRENPAWPPGPAPAGRARRGCAKGRPAGPIRANA